jgi:hypothetical protein
MSTKNLSADLLQSVIDLEKELCEQCRGSDQWQAVRAAAANAASELIRIHGPDENQQLRGFRR